MSRRGSLLARRVDAAEADGRRRALRTLLMNPLITAAGDRERLALVRRHAEWLEEWFVHYANWHLHVDAELARLNKTPAEVDASHPAKDRQGNAFTRRRYVLLCLALASLERAGRQTTLHRLAEDIQGQIAGDPELSGQIALDAGRRDDRVDLVAFGRFLVDRQIIARVHGDEDSYLSASGDCLYEIRREILSRILAVRCGPSQVASDDPGQRLKALQYEAFGEGDEAKNRATRTRLVRHLLERPVLYDAKLDAESREYLVSQRPHLLRALCEATGLVAEIRAEGMALVDPDRELTDFPIPEEGTRAHGLLLLAGWLVERMRPDGRAQVPLAAVESYIVKCAAENLNWRRDVRTAEGAVHFSHELIDVLIALDLAVRTGDTIMPLPALARLGLAEPVLPTPQDLFGDAEKKPSPEMS